MISKFINVHVFTGTLLYTWLTAWTCFFMYTVMGWWWERAPEYVKVFGVFADICTVIAFVIGVISFVIIFIHRIEMISVKIHIGVSPVVQPTGPLQLGQLHANMRATTQPIITTGFMPVLEVVIFNDTELTTIVNMINLTYLNDRNVYLAMPLAGSPHRLACKGDFVVNKVDYHCEDQFGPHKQLHKDIAELTIFTSRARYKYSIPQEAKNYMRQITQEYCLSHSITAQVGPGLKVWDCNLIDKKDLKTILK